LSITTGRCDLAIATHARKMHKKHQYDCRSILVSHYPKPMGGQPQEILMHFPSMSRNGQVAMASCNRQAFF
jgi:hypothetical protein